MHVSDVNTYIWTHNRIYYRLLVSISFSYGILRSIIWYRSEIVNREALHHTGTCLYAWLYFELNHMPKSILKPMLFVLLTKRKLKQISMFLWMLYMNWCVWWMDIYINRIWVFITSIKNFKLKKCWSGLYVGITRDWAFTEIYI